MAERRFYHWGLVALCLLAFGLRLYLLEDLTLHEDEALSQEDYVQQPFSHIFTHYTPNNHWLASALGHLLGRLGPQRFLLRWPAVLFGTLAVPLLGAAGAQLFKSRLDGLVAALLLCLSAFHLQWSQQFRGYSELLFWGLLALVLLPRALRTDDRRSWGALLAATLLALASHLFGGLVLVTVIGIIAGRYGYDLVSGAVRPALRGPAAAVALVGVLGFGWVLWFGKTQVIDVYHASLPASLAQRIGSQWTAVGSTLPDIYDFLSRLAVAFTHQPHEAGALLLFWGLILTGLAFAWANTPRTTGLLALWLLIPLAAVVGAELAIAGFFVFDRFLIFLLPVWLLLVSRSLTGCYRWIARVETLSPIRIGLALLPLLIGIGYLAQLDWMMARAYFAYRAGHDWRAIATYLADQTGPNDLILCHALPHHPFKPADECSFELRQRLAEAGISTRYPIQSLTGAIQSPGDHPLDSRLTQPGTVRLVLWGPEVAGLDDLPSGSKGALPPSTLLPFNDLGQTLLLQVKHEASLITNLRRSLEDLAWLDTTSPARFEYYSYQAKIWAVQGNIIEAQTALNRAKALASDQPAAQPHLLETARLLAVGYSNPVVTGRKTAVDFGRPPNLRLIGHNLPPLLQPNQTVPITLAWQVRAPLPADYSVFLHLRDTTGQNIAQLDFRPFDDAYPTSRWLPRTEIKETRFWTLPPELPAGTFSLYLGLYQAETLARLPLTSDESGENALLLEEIEVK